MQRILVVGANPAWQKVLQFTRFCPGEVNRARTVTEFPSGKGVNFCRAARCHGGAETRLYHFAGGDTGRRLDTELTAAGWSVVSVPVPAPTRVCTTLLDAAGGMTELIEPSATVPPAAVARLRDALTRALAEADTAAVAMVGTLPGATDPALYRETAGRTLAAGRRFLLDAAAGAVAALDLAGENDGMALKVNRGEFFRLCAVADPGGEAALERLLRDASRRWPRAALAVTAGAEAAWLARGGRLWRFVPAAPETMVSPLGCGDTAAAVWLAELVNGTEPAEAFARALAAASANCLNELCGSYPPAAAARLRPAVAAMD